MNDRATAYVNPPYSIPAVLDEYRDAPVWLGWRWEERKGKRTKHPQLGMR